MTREEIIDGLEIYTVGRLNKDIIHITVEELQKFIDEIKTLKQKPCEDCISRQALITSLQGHRNFFVNSYGTYKHMAPKDKVRIDEIDNCISRIVNAPSVTPQYTYAEIQKMQKLEQAEIEKAYELGKAEMQPSEDAISRQDTLAEFKRVYFDNDTVIRCAELVLGGMPSVTPQPKSGNQQKSEWVVSFHGFPPEPTTACKKCGFDRDFNINPRYFNKIKYCPNCGKMMEVEK